MCGIAGMWNRGGDQVDKEALARMQKSLSHRGPDHAGSYIAGGVGLSHTRLSIIDISSTGSQPYTSSDGRYVLVFNGEIYNYKELKEKYFSGVVFRSSSDTEVLLEMLIRFGAQALPLLRGMFAFCFYDTIDQVMILACDPFGKKPLFYTTHDQQVIFASEPKAILVSEQFITHFDNQIVAPYLLHEYCPSPMSGYEGIVALDGGHYVEITLKEEKKIQWWVPRVSPKLQVSLKAAQSTFDDLLGRAVERRMLADVPVGIFLSGGLDSSTIAWYMRQIRKQGDLHSCSVGFTEKSFNEDHFASLVASRLGFIHHGAQFTKEVFLESLQEIVPFMDIPFADPSLLPTYVLSKLARAHMKVALDGDGSDELLGGYGTFQAYELLRDLQWVPGQAWDRLLRVAQYAIPVSHQYFSLDFKIKSFLRGAMYAGDRSMQVWLGAFSPQEIEDVLIDKKIAHSDTLFRGVDAVVGPDILGPFDRASLYHVGAYMQKDILVKIDRATMAVGLEARTPFLDVDVAEFLLRLPASYKRNKRILKELMRGRLPDAIINRKKQGFGIPIASWFAGELFSFIEELLSYERIVKVGVFRYDRVRDMIREHRDGAFDHRKKLWAILMFQLWYEYWILDYRPISQDGPPPQIS